MLHIRISRPSLTTTISRDPNHDDDEPFPRSRPFASSVVVDQEGQNNTRLLIVRTDKCWRETGSVRTRQTRRSKYGEKEVPTQHLSLEPGYPGTAVRYLTYTHAYLTASSQASHHCLSSPVPVFGTTAWRLDHRHIVPRYPTVRTNRPSLPTTTADARCLSLKALGLDPQPQLFRP